MCKNGKNDKSGKDPEHDDPIPAPENLPLFIKETRHGGMFKPEAPENANPEGIDDIAGNAVEAKPDATNGSSDPIDDIGEADDDFFHGVSLEDMGRQARNWAAVAVGKPRLINLSTGQTAVARLVDDSALSSKSRRGNGSPDEFMTHDLAMSLTEPMDFGGPRNHARG